MPKGKKKKEVNPHLLQKIDIFEKVLSDFSKKLHIFHVWLYCNMKIV
jgi:hypothetical protein